MATICKTVCDRCGKEVHYIGWTSKLKRIGLLSILNGNPSGYDFAWERMGRIVNERTREDFGRD